MLEKRREGDRGGFRTHDPCAELYGNKSSFGSQVDLRIFPAALWSDQGGYLFGAGGRGNCTAALFREDQAEPGLDGRVVMVVDNTQGADAMRQSARVMGCGP